MEIFTKKSGLIMASVLLLSIFSLFGCGNNNNQSVDSEPSASVIQSNDTTYKTENSFYKDFSFAYNSDFSIIDQNGTIGLVFEAQEAFVSIMQNDTGYNVNDELKGNEASLQNLLDISLASFTQTLDPTEEKVSYRKIDGVEVAVAELVVEMGDQTKNVVVLTALVDTYQYYITYMCTEGHEKEAEYKAEFDKVIESIKFS